MKKAEQDTIKAMIEALEKAAAAFKGSAETIKVVKTMKDDFEKEINEKLPMEDAPAG